MDRSAIERREFIKRAGAGSAALAAFPVLADAAWAHDERDHRRRRFYFQALSGQGPALNEGETIVMSACGSFGRRSVRGGGEFIHFDGTKPLPSRDFIATGSWRATRFLSFQEIGTWGVGVAGVLEMLIKLMPCGGPTIRGATLKIVCNLGPAGLVTSPFQQEGFFLTVPGITTFSPFTPNLGLTLLTRPCGERDDDAELEDEED
jgi:hypothetical protein